MKKIKYIFSFLTLLISLLLLFGCSSDKIKLGYVSYKEPDSSKIISTKNLGVIPINQIGIILKNGLGKSDAEKIASLVNGKVVGEMEYINLYQIENNNSTEDELITQLEKLLKTEGVENAFPNGAVYVCGSENAECNVLEDPVYEGENSKPFEMIGLKNAWDIIKITKVKLNSVKVGVNDSKLGTKSNEITGEAGIAGNSADDLDNNNSRNHANGVVNIIGANSKNGGVSGVASILGKNLNINVIGSFSTSEMYKEVEKDTTDVTQSIFFNGKSYTIKFLVDLQKQVESGAKVINCSFSNKAKNEYEEFSAWKCKAVKRFLEKMSKDHPDVLFVAAAGNNNCELKEFNSFWMHNLPNVVTVGALDKEGNQSDYTNYGTGNGEITLSACGESMLDDGWEERGTSLSTPQVTGVAAIMKSINPNLTAAEIKQILIETASKKVNGIEVPAKLGAGCLRADEAVLRVINDLRKKEGKEPLKMEDIIGLANVYVTSSGGPEEFTVTATINKTSPEGGTALEIDISGGAYTLTEEKVKTINSPGAVGWVIKKPDLETVLRVKVKRLDNDNCRVVLLKSLIDPKILLGKWDGEVVAVNWSATNELIRKYSASIIDAIIGEPKPLTIFVENADEKNVFITLKVEGGKVIPQKKFSFINNKLHSEFFFDKHNYTYDAEVKEEGDKITIKGEWKTVTYNNTVTMNGTWKCSKKKDE